MRSQFQLTAASLSTDRASRTIWILGAAVLTLAAWLAWAALAHVSLYAVSSSARVELDGATYPVDSPFVGRIVSTRLKVGSAVRRGDMLVELDCMPQQLELQEMRVQIAGIEPQLARLAAQVEGEQLTRAEQQDSARLGANEALNRVREAEIPAVFAEQDLARIRKLYEEHTVSARELQRAESEAARLRSAVGTLRVSAARVPQDQAARNREREVGIARLRGEIATLEARRAVLQADAARLNYEIERRRIRSPVDGHIGEAANRRVGAVVAEGERLGSVVPNGHLLIVAQYPAHAAFGRIRAGQSATLRLDGFPWAEFGTVAATVAAVAQEVRDGNVRVELALDRQSSFRGALQHGMPGTLEVAVERVTPLGLVLRTSGQWLSRPL